jgi:hypothetical protein
MKNMSTERNIFEELKYRIENEIKHRGVKLDDVVNAAWRGYLAAALEWGIISVAEHDKLNDLLPPLANDCSAPHFLDTNLAILNELSPPRCCFGSTDFRIRLA